MKTYFLPNSEPERAIWIANFAQKLNTYSATLGITAAQITSITNDSRNYGLMINYKEAVNQYKKQLTEYCTVLSDGSTQAGTGATATPPAPPTLPTLTSPVNIDIFGRLRLMVQGIKANTNYSPAIGQDLGVIGEEQTNDRLSLKPTLKIIMEAGHPTIVWTKGKTDGIKIMASRAATGNFSFLAIDTKPNYTDMAALPTAGVSAVWRYQAIYIKDDQEVGQWSDTIQVTVTGV